MLDALYRTGLVETGFVRKGLLPPVAAVVPSLFFELVPLRILLFDECPLLEKGDF